ncbi:IS66 family insertion sequence element accessory protein TnpB [Paenibacillus naphthalenovorans]
MKAWCENHHIAFGQMKYWIRKLGLRQRSRRAAAPNWIEVTPTATSASSIVVRVGAAEIEVAAGFDAALLKQVVQTLGDHA